MLSRTRFLPLAALRPLAGCGFSPLYANGGGSQTLPQQLAEVQVLNIPERPGQMLRQAIEDQFYTAGPPTVQRYALAVSYGISTQGIGIQSDTSVTRNRFIAVASWSLVPVGAPAKPLAAGTATPENAENVIDQQYFALTLETTTIDQQLANTLAQQIATQVAAYFRTHPTA